MTTYEEFLASKRLIVPNQGVDVRPEELPISLFPFQRALVCWSLRKGRAALFAATGLGKTLCQLSWAEQAAERTLILAPLAVAQQTVREGEKFGITATYCRRQGEAPARGITVTNYEVLHHFDPDAFGAVVLDESSCLKDHSSVYRVALTEAFRHTPMKLCASATPAPNDISEIGTHAEFLGAMTRQEMIAHFFINRSAGKDLQLKRHGREAFWRWLASWGMTLNHPSDLGFDAPGYDLPPLTVDPVFVETGYQPRNRLFADRLEGVTERAAVRRDTLAARVKAAVEIVQAEPEEQWLIWTGLNDESKAMTAACADAVEVEGADSLEDKQARLLDFAERRLRVLVTKREIAGHGLNLQNCARMVFVGLNDSFEGWYQCVRRCWRYGQTREVKVWAVLSEPERVIWENVRRKEEEAAVMSRELVRHVAEFERNELAAKEANAGYQSGRHMLLPDWMRENGSDGR
jgi:hypothetical protein